MDRATVTRAIAASTERDLTRALELLGGYVRAVERGGSSWTEHLAGGDGRIDLPQPGPDDQVALVLAAAALLCGDSDRMSVFSLERLSTWALVRELTRRKLPYTDADIVHLAGCFLNFVETRTLNDHSAILLGVVMTYAKGRTLPDEAVAKLRRAREIPAPPVNFPNIVKQVKGLESLVGPKIEGARIGPGEAWSDQALADLGAMAAPSRQQWEELLAHCQTATAAKPPAKWLKEAQAKVGVVGFEAFKDHVLRWFPLVDKPRTRPLEPARRGAPSQEDMIEPHHIDLLKGLAWSCGLHEDPELARELVRLAFSAYRKIAGRGPRLVALGNAAVTALGMMPGTAALGPLALLKVKVKFGSAQKELEKALVAAAERAGLPRDEIDELGVPAYGLNDVGLRRESVGEYTAMLTINGGDVDLRWFKADGKELKSVPAALKKEHAEDVKELQASAKDAAQMLSAQRERIDGLFLAGKTWPFESWRERYLNHPLVGTIARALVWRFATEGAAADGIWRDGRIEDRHGRPIEGLGPATTVALWHPIGATLEDVMGWRSWLEDHQVRQPFKQAHREIYLLTDAERQTGVYSNRYAAHILRQHQYHALCGARSWKNKLRLMVDADYPPSTRLLPHWGLRAEYWVEGAGDDYGRDANDTGVYHYLMTDQVRFYPIDAAHREAHASGGGYRPPMIRDDAAISLDQVPPLVFSEIMRDVDLFVGVASVGNDPTWSDGGPEGRYREYWRSFSIGELSATGQTRKAVLERLIPRLKIASRCSFNDRFLVVKGDLRTYGIHLGSGNILMEPNDQYLCIVPRQSAIATDERLFLPFEGDSTLSIILSKALLLANDTKITDPTITAQIRRFS